MKSLILLIIFNYLIAIIPEWNITKIGDNIMTSDSITYTVCTKYYKTNHKAVLTRTLTKENGTITKTNKVKVNDDQEKIVEFDDIGSFHYLNERYYICPKGSHHLYDYLSDQYIKPKENFEAKEKFQLKCTYHETSSTFLVFYLLNGKNYIYGIYIKKEDADIADIKRIAPVGIELYDYKLDENLISGTDADYYMLALTNQGSNIILGSLKAILRQNDNYYFDQRLNQVGSIPIGKVMSYTQSYFKVSENDDYMDFYYIAYNDINNFYSGYSKYAPSYSDVSKVTVNSSKVSFEFYEDVEIEEMNFMPYNRYVYYKMKLKNSSETKYYGIYDTKLFKVIFNTKEYIKYYIPYSSLEMLAITNDSAYRICSMKDINNDKCVDYCSNNYLLDTEGNKCSDSYVCPDNKIMLVPSGVCNQTCDENIYYLNGNECGLCQYFFPSDKKYKLIGINDCIEKMTDTMEYYNQKFNILKCKEGYIYKNGDCVSDKDKECYELCQENQCTDSSKNISDQKCTKCINGYLLEKGNCLTQCSNGYEKLGDICQFCDDNKCQDFETNSCNCVKCREGKYLINDTHKCENCNEICLTCSSSVDCLSCNTSENSKYKYLIFDDYNKTCVENCTLSGREFVNNSYECAPLKKNNGTNYEEGKENDVEYWFWIVFVILLVLLIIVTIFIFKACCCSKDEYYLEEVSTELIEENKESIDSIN